MTEDENKNKLISVLNLFLNSNLKSNFLDKKEFKEFMSMPNVQSLKIHTSEDKDNNKDKDISYLLSNSLTQVTKDSYVTLIVFYKSTPKELTFENFFNEVNFTLCRCSDFKLIYSCLH